MPENLSPELGRRIGELRAVRGWTQQQLAERLAVSRAAVSHLEAGLSIPGERTVALLAGVFSMEPYELVAGTDYPSAKAERLPAVVARYTEVEHQLALLDADLCWIDRGADLSVARAVLDRWIPRLVALRAAAADPVERSAVTVALRSLRDRAA